MAARAQIGVGLLLAVGCSSAAEPAPPVVIVPRSTEELPVESPPKAPPPESDHPSVFADEPERGRKRRKRRKRRKQQPASSLVGSSARDKSEGDVALRHRIFTGARGPEVDETTLKVINDNSQAISHCVADAARRGERATGKMEVEVVVAEGGRVSSTRLLSEDYVGTILGSCVLRRIKEWRFGEAASATRLVLPFVVEAAH